MPRLDGVLRLFCTAMSSILLTNQLNRSSSQLLAALEQRAQIRERPLRLRLRRRCPASPAAQARLHRRHAALPLPCRGTIGSASSNSSAASAARCPARRAPGTSPTPPARAPPAPHSRPAPRATRPRRPAAWRRGSAGTAGCNTACSLISATASALLATELHRTPAPALPPSENSAGIPGRSPNGISNSNCARLSASLGQIARLGPAAGHGARMIGSRCRQVKARWRSVKPLFLHR